MIFLNEVRRKVNAVSKEDWTLHSECAEKLQEISESVCAFESDIARIIGMVIADRMEEYVDNAKNMKS